MATDARSDQTLFDILEIAAAISGASDLRGLLHLILRKARAITSADAGSIFLVEKSKPAPFWAELVDTQSKDCDCLWFAVSQNDSLDVGIEEKVLDIRFPITPERLVGWCALNGEILNLPDVYALDSTLPYQFDSSIDQQLGYRAVSMLTVPLRMTSGDIVGVLQLINRKRDPSAVISPESAVAATQPFDAFDQQLIESLSSLAAVCVERTRLVDAQDKLIDSIISLLAGAIDAKSPYTGGHCERVPQLALMLAEAAEAVSEGPLASFRFGSAEAWREFRTGAWLHDCGKVTTPEYVVDKATKLEMNGNRIHEIRTRFEVLWRDAEIEFLKALLEGGDPDELDRTLKERQELLREQFAFVAQCNLGAEFFDEVEADELRRIGAQRWMRHFDDSLGLAWEEKERRLKHDPPSDMLPMEQMLLMDSPWHCVPRSGQDCHDSKHGFKLNPPEYLFNYGEIYNLSISRGTLTAEERYKINDHIMQTIVMLDSLPFPPGLQRVSEYAGTHHEALNGAGYPRGLSADRLSIPSRIMAIADIFEALTASDRPYKKAKTLSESVRILSGFRDRGHIDPILFELFLTSGVCEKYAQKFLKPEQVDRLVVADFLE